MNLLHLSSELERFTQQFLCLSFRNHYENFLFQSEETVKCEDEQEKMVFTSKHNENQNNKLGNKECAEEDEKLIRLASASSYYSAG